MLSGKLRDIDNGVGQQGLGLVGHVHRSGGKSPVEERAVAAQGHCVDRLGTVAAADPFGLGRVLKAPRTAHHTHLKTFVGHISLVVDVPHLGGLGQRLAHQGRKLLGSLGRGTVNERHLHAVRTFEDGVAGAHAVCPLVEALAIPVGLQSHAAAYTLAQFGHRDDGPVEVVGEILGLDALHEALSVHHGLLLFKRLGLSVQHGHVVVVRHLVVVVVGHHHLHRGEILAQELLERGGALLHAALVLSLVVVGGKRLQIGVSAHIEHA